MRVTVTVLRGRTVESGVWCQPCLLPSAHLVEVLIAMSHPGPGGATCITRTEYQRRVWCQDCGRTTVPPPA